MILTYTEIPRYIICITLIIHAMMSHYYLFTCDPGTFQVNFYCYPYAPRGYNTIQCESLVGQVAHPMFLICCGRASLLFGAFVQVGQCCWIVVVNQLLAQLIFTHAQ